MSESIKGATTLTLSDFGLHQAHLELRTSPRFLHWDRAGGLWTEMIEKHPMLRAVRSEPNKTAFSMANYHFSISFDYNPLAYFSSLAISTFFPSSSLVEFIKVANDFIDICQRHLDIVEYSRIGLRVVYVKLYPDRELASKAMIETGLLKTPSTQFFGVDSHTLNPSYSIRLEDKSNGVFLRLFVETYKTDFKPPADLQGVPAIEKEEHQFVLDFDLYTLASVNTEQLSIEEWVSRRLQFIRRDADLFLRGLQ